MGDIAPLSNEEALKLCGQSPEETKVCSWFPTYFGYLGVNKANFEILAMLFIVFK